MFSKRTFKKTLFVGIALLLIPLFAMLFTEEVNWTLGDFAMAAILIAVTSLLISMIDHLVKNNRSRMILIFGLAIFILLVWAELAVGIFGSTFAGS